MLNVMPTSHIEKRIESSEVERFYDRHFKCDIGTCLVLVTEIYLLSYLWKNTLETIDLN